MKEGRLSLAVGRSADPSEDVLDVVEEVATPDASATAVKAAFAAPTRAGDIIDLRGGRCGTRKWA